MKAGIIFLAIMFAIACCTIVFFANLLRLMKEERNYYKTRCEQQDITIKKILQTSHEAIQLASQCRKEREDLVNALQYADHFIKPRKRLCMWQIATKHLKKNEE